MNLVRAAAALAIAGVSGALAYGATRGPRAEAPSQPIAFNHALHTGGKPKLACGDCHEGVYREARAGLPPLERCLACHMKKQNDSPEESKVRALAASPEPFAWTPVTRNAGHVYFSHRAHATLAEMPCTTCHGDVASWTSPPTTARRELLSMDTCIDCHRARGAPIGCRSCHH